MSTFSDIYGYDTIKEHLQNAIKLDKVSHAYIINGGLGAGKKMIAKIFAKALQCEAEGDNKPCNKCHSCIHKACKVPFQPREDRPVYCSDCFARMKQN